MKSIKSRVTALERQAPTGMYPIIIKVCFVPATTTDGRPCPAPEPYETITLHIGKPEGPTS